MLIINCNRHEKGVSAKGQLGIEIICHGRFINPLRVSAVLHLQ